MLYQQKLVTANGERVAIVDGIRTPFAKKDTVFKDVYAKDLGTMVTSELINRLPIESDLIQQLIFGQVIQDPDVPNIAREISILLNMPQVQSYTVSSSCATGMQAVANMTTSIVAGSISCGIAGGADSISNAPIRLNSQLIKRVKEIIQAKGIEQKYQLFKQIKYQDFKLQAVNLKDPLTGLSLSDVSEQMAQDFGFTRAELDQYALRSHRLAQQAWQSGVLRNEVMVSFPQPYTNFVVSDNHIVKNPKPHYYEKFQPFNGEHYGTATDWNTSHSCDGAAAILMMNESLAKAQGLEVLGYIRSYAITANDVWKNMFTGSVYASSLALQRAGVQVADLDLVDIHETSAAQVLANLRLFEDESFAQQYLNCSQAIGAVDMDKFNVLGGSLAYGNPRAVSSLRLIIQSLYELRRKEGNLALVASGSLGGLGGAIVLERE